MTQRTIKLGFTRYSDKTLDRKARKILGRMTGNPYFPDPVPSLKDIQQQVAEFKASLDALDGRPLNYMLKKRARKSLEKSLKLLGGYVIRHGAHDESILGSSGYDMVQEIPSKGIPEPPDGFRVKKLTGTGQMLVSADGVPGAGAYLFEYTEAPLTGDSVWITATDARPVHVFDQLVPGKAYCFRMGVVSNDAAPAYTGVISRLVS